MDVGKVFRLHCATCRCRPRIADMPLILWHIALLLLRRRRRRHCQPCVFLGVYCSFWCDGNRVELFVVVTGFCDNDNLFVSRGEGK